MRHMLALVWLRLAKDPTDSKDREVVSRTVINMPFSPVEWLVIKQLILTLASSLCRLDTLMVVLM